MTAYEELGRGQWMELGCIGVDVRLYAPASSGEQVCVGGGGEKRRGGFRSQELGASSPYAA